MSRVVGVILLWLGCASPLWFFMSRDTSVLVFLPFFVNIFSLHWDFFEARGVDWRVLVFNFVTSSVLSILMLFSLEKGIESISAWVTVGLMTAISLAGGITFASIRIRFLVDRLERISLLKLTVITLVHAGIVWAIESSSWNSDNSLIINTAIGGLITGSAILSIVERSDPRRVSTGQPLFWLGVRILLSPLLSGFWIWAIVCLIDFIILNMLVRESSCLEGAWITLKRLQKSNLAFGGFNLVASSAILITVLAGPAIETWTTVSVDRENLRVMRVLGTTGQEYNTSSARVASEILAEWASNRLYELRVFDTRISSLSEQTGLLLTVALLFGGAVFHSLSKSQGEFRWISIFYFLTAAMILYFPYEEVELGLLARGELFRRWSIEAMTVVVLSVVGGMANFFSLFREFAATEQGDIILQKKYTGSSSLNRVSLSVVFCFLLGLAGLELICYSGILTQKAEIAFGPSGFERCLTDFYMGTDNESAIALSRAPTLCANYTQMKGSIGLASTLRTEMLVAGIASLVGASFAFVSIAIAALGEVVLIALGLNLCLLVTVVPSRIVALRNYPVDWSKEYEVPLICAINTALFVSLVAIREIRRRSWDFWKSEQQLIEDFAASRFLSYRDMIRARTGSDIGPIDNPEEVIAHLREKRRDDLAMGPAVRGEILG